MPISTFTPAVVQLTATDAQVIVVPSNASYRLNILVSNTDTVQRLVYLHLRTGAVNQNNAIFWGTPIDPGRVIEVSLEAPANWIVSGKADLTGKVNVIVTGWQEA